MCKKMEKGDERTEDIDVIIKPRGINKELGIVYGERDDEKKKGGGK